MTNRHDSREGRRRTRQGAALAVALGLILAACQAGPFHPPPEEPLEPLPVSQHIEIDPPVDPDIPSPVRFNVFPMKPKPRKRLETYSVVVLEHPVRSLLMSLARDANLNLDIHPEVQGAVTLNVIEATLPRILERISQLVDLRFKFSGADLIVTPDKPYLKIYQVDYINLERNAATNIRLTNQVASLDGSDQTGDNHSSLSVDSLSNNPFWETVIDNIRGIIGLVEEETPPTVEKEKDDDPEKKTTASRTETADGEEKDEADAKKEIWQGRTTAVQGSRLVAANPQSGVISVRATHRQHEEIQSFLDQVLSGIRRQVMIEATVVEIQLSDQYQAGIDWENANSLFFSFQLNKAKTVFDSLTGRIRFLEKFGKVKVLSTPKLMTINNQMAVLKVVDNEVYFTMDTEVRENDSGNDKTTFTTHLHTVPIGLVMNIIPQISRNGEVTLIVRPSISRIIDFVTDPNPNLGDSQESLIPKIQVREMESILTVPSGRTTVIGGLMQDTAQKNVTGLPWLSYLPVVGSLFDYRDDTVEKSELAIFLRPTVIESGQSATRPRDLGLLKYSQTPGRRSAEWNRQRIER